MEKRQRLRNAGILCCYFLRNLAYYRSGWRNGQLLYQEQFWINVNSNFLDIAVLEWCKLFADKNGKHYWSKLVTNADAYLIGYLNAVDIDEENFDKYTIQMKTYRDKFVAHLDEEPRMNIPCLDIAKNSIIYLYEYLLKNEDINGCFQDVPMSSGSDLYDQFEQQAVVVYDIRS